MFPNNIENLIKLNNGQKFTETEQNQAPDLLTRIQTNIGINAQAGYSDIATRLNSLGGCSLNFCNITILNANIDTSSEILDFTSITGETNSVVYLMISNNTGGTKSFIIGEYDDSSYTQITGSGSGYCEVVNGDIAYIIGITGNTGLMKLTMNTGSGSVNVKLLAYIK